jgi:hypothetical protein
MDPRDTNERLRHWLNSNQPARERMCAAVLALSGVYTRIEPRLPEGGPDGGRDLQGVFDGNKKFFAGVGFQNNVSDSPEDKRLTKKKFRDDIASAREADANVTVFVFFTNVELTPGERDELVKFAHEQGVSFVEIYWRERLRQALDSPEGLAFRYQYLGMPLSEAEQATFFNNFGRDLQQIILQQHEQMKEGVRRLEFLHWMSRPIKQLKLMVVLNRFHHATELPPFRVVAKLFNTPETDSAWYIGGTDLRLRHGDGHEGISSRTVVAVPDSNKVVFAPSSGNLFQHGLATLSFGVSLARSIGAPTPELLEGRIANIFATKGIAEKITTVSLYINGYRMASWIKPHFKPWRFDVEWPEPMQETNEDSQWMGCHDFPPRIDLTITPSEGWDS